MDPTLEVNERVDVIAVYKKRGDIASLCMPAKMRWRGREIELVELGLRHPTQAGNRMIHVFHVSDGINGYRLEFDAEALTWTLVCLISGEDHA
jgi:hypothetical protein